MISKLIASLVAVILVGSAGAAIVYTDIADQTTAVGVGGTISPISLTGGLEDSFDFHLLGSGPYPFWSEGLTTGNDSQIAMANGYHAKLSLGTDVTSPTTWVGGDLLDGSSFFQAFSSSGDPNAWKNDTGYVGLRVAQGGGSYIYGWAEFTIVETADPEERSITLTRYAYEDQINTAITAGAVPEPATALSLLIGGGLLAIIRRMTTA